MEATEILSLCGGCAHLAAESRPLGLQFASVGRWKLRVAALDCQGPLQLLGRSPQTATPLAERLHSQHREAAKQPKGRLNGKGLTAFFVHGGGGRAGQFRHLLHFLSQRGVQCVAPDLPGHGVSRLAMGGSESVPVCSFEDTQIILKTTFDALAATRPACNKGEKEERNRAVLVGHSFGSLHVLQLYGQLVAENRAEEVAGICLIGSDAAQRPKGKGVWLLLHLPLLLLQLFRGLIGRLAQRLLYCRETFVYNKVLLEQEREITSRNSFEVVLRILAELESGIARNRFQRAAATFRDSPRRPPVLLVYGEEDRLSPPASCAASLAAALGAGHLPSTLPSPQYLRLPSTATAAGGDGSDGGALASPTEWARTKQVTAVLVGRAGHNVMLEQPLETNRVVWEFVKQLFSKT